MKVISLLQPWAQLVVMGHKRIETRSFDTKYRGPVLIHASLGKYAGTKENRISLRELCYKPHFKEIIGGGLGFDKLPFGCVVDANVAPILDREAVYSGCYGKVSVNFYPFDAKGNKGVACGLNNLQKLKEGEPLGNGRSKAEDDFQPIAETEDDDFM